MFRDTHIVTHVTHVTTPCDTWCCHHCFPYRQDLLSRFANLLFLRISPCLVQVQTVAGEQVERQKHLPQEVLEGGGVPEGVVEPEAVG